MPDSRDLPFVEALRPSAVFLRCPIRASLDVLGRKWTLLILYSMTFFRAERFSEIRRYIPEITPRILSRRLAQLEAAGFIARQQARSPPRTVVWRLTPRGQDTLPILIRLIEHVAKWEPESLFEDKAPRTLRDIFSPRIALTYAAW